MYKITAEYMVGAQYHSSRARGLAAVRRRSRVRKPLSSSLDTELGLKHTCAAMAAAHGEVDLTVVIPAYNEEARLGPTLVAVMEYCAAMRPEYEIIVVDDGSTDGTVDVARTTSGGSDRVRVIEQGLNRGKGAAVRAGMLAARGSNVLFSDADLSTPIAEVAKLQQAIDSGSDIAIASRALKTSQIDVRQHPVREFMGRTFNLLVRVAGLGGIKDTQCGFKLFTREAAQDLFGRAELDGFAFDVEVLMLARYRYRVCEVPVIWRHVEESKVSPGSDAARMFADLLILRLKTWRF